MNTCMTILFLNDKGIIRKFINKFHKDILPSEHPILDSLTKYAINYFKDKVEPNKKFKTPDSKEKIALIKLIEKIKEVPQSTKPEDIQTLIYSTGKENGYEKNLRDWFKLIYEVVFGEKWSKNGLFYKLFWCKRNY